MSISPDLVRFAVDFLAANADEEVLEMLTESLGVGAGSLLDSAQKTVNGDFFVVVLPEREYDSYCVWYDGDGDN